MKKYLYLASCLLVGMTLNLSSCSDDDPILPTPEEPEQPEQPEQPETTYIEYYEIKLNLQKEDLSEGQTLAKGDSLAFYNLVEKKVKFMQDSIKQANSSLTIDYSTNTRTIGIYDSLNIKGNASKAWIDLSVFIAYLNLKPQGFVYTGFYLFQNGLISISDKNVLGGTRNYLYCSLPPLKGTWETSDDAAEIRTLTFQKDVFLNEDSETLYSYNHDGYDITLQEGDAEKYLFRLNKEGTEIQLVKADGEEIENGPTYTNPVFSGN